MPYSFLGDNEREPDEELKNDIENRMGCELPSDILSLLLSPRQDIFMSVPLAIFAQYADVVSIAKKIYKSDGYKHLSEDQQERLKEKVIAPPSELMEKMKFDNLTDHGDINIDNLKKYNEFLMSFVDIINQFRLKILEESGDLDSLFDLDDDQADE